VVSTLDAFAGSERTMDYIEVDSHRRIRKKVR